MSERTEYEPQMDLPCPGRMPSANFITDGIMLKSKQRMQHLHAEPPVIVESCLGGAINVAWKEDLFVADPVEDEFAVLVVTSQTCCDSLA